jgi:hypothetical protein
MANTKFHTHETEDGILVKCYHSSKNTLLSMSFWLGVTLSFPIEHWLWHNVWPFKILAGYLGLD